MKCPSCGQAVVTVAAQGVNITVSPGGKTFKGLAYGCVACGGVLGCQIDPIAVKTDIINGVVDEVRRLIPRLGP